MIKLDKWPHTLCTNIIKCFLIMRYLVQSIYQNKKFIQFLYCLCNAERWFVNQASVKQILTSESEVLNKIKPCLTASWLIAFYHHVDILRYFWFTDYLSKLIYQKTKLFRFLKCLMQVSSYSSAGSMAVF